MLSGSSHPDFCVSRSHSTFATPTASDALLPLRLVSRRQAGKRRAVLRAGPGVRGAAHLATSAPLVAVPAGVRLRARHSWPGECGKEETLLLAASEPHGTAPRLRGGSAGGPASPTWALGGRGASLTTRPGSTSFPARVSSLGGPLWQRLGAGRCAGRQKRKNNGRAGSERGRASGRSRNPEVSA